MDFDDDAPPDLVETTGAEIEEEEKPGKVPITIVTGKFLCYASVRKLDTDNSGQGTLELERQPC